MRTDKRWLLPLCVAVGMGILLTLLSGLALAKPPDPEDRQYIWVPWHLDMEAGPPEDVFIFSHRLTAEPGTEGDATNFSEFELVGPNCPTYPYTFEGALELVPIKHPFGYTYEHGDYFGYYFWLYDYKETREVYIKLDYEDRYDEYVVVVTRTNSAQWDYVLYNCSDCTIDAQGSVVPKNGYIDPPYAVNATHEYYWAYANTAVTTRMLSGDGEEWSDITWEVTPMPHPDEWVCDYVDDGDGTLGCYAGEAPNLVVDHSWVSSTGCDGPGGYDECAARSCTAAEGEKNTPPEERVVLVIDAETPEESMHPDRVRVYRERVAAGMYKPPWQRPWYERLWRWLVRLRYRIFPLPEVQDTNQWWECHNRYIPMNPPTPTPRPTLEP